MVWPNILQRTTSDETCAKPACVPCSTRARDVVFLELIEKKRDGGELDAAEIRWFVEQYVADDIADYQMSALLMAIMWRGLSDEGTAQLTLAMADSGVRFDFSSLPGPKVDKHSTGGVGDKVSLLLAPLAAACGCLRSPTSGRRT